MYYSKTYFENDGQRAFQKNTPFLSFYYCPSSKNHLGGLLPFYLLDNSIFDRAEQLDTDAIYELMKKAYKNDQVGFVKIFSSYLYNDYSFKNVNQRVNINNYKRGQN
jgi:hypothetical protein